MAFNYALPLLAPVARIILLVSFSVKEAAIYFNQYCFEASHQVELGWGIVRRTRQKLHFVDFLLNSQWTLKFQSSYTNTSRELLSSKSQGKKIMILFLNLHNYYTINILISSFIFAWGWDCEKLLQSFNRRTTRLGWRRKFILNIDPDNLYANLT